MFLQTTPATPDALASDALDVVPVVPDPSGVDSVIVPTPQAWEVWLAWGIVPLAGVLVFVLWWSGVLSPIRLRLAPNRRVRLTGWDALIGIWLWLMGSVMAGGVAAALIMFTAALRGDSVQAPDRVDTGAPGVILVLQLCSFGPPIVWLLWRVRSRLGKRVALRQAGLIPRRPGRELLWVAAALPAALLLSMGTQVFFTTLATLLGDPPPTIQHDLLNKYTDMRDQGQWLAIALLTVSTVIVAPLTEELFNRGLLQTSLLAWWGPDRRWWVIGAVSVFFSLLHVGSVPVVALPALLLLGVVFGFLYERTGSLWPSILVHAGFNGLNVLYVLAAA